MQIKIICNTSQRFFFSQITTQIQLDYEFHWFLAKKHAFGLKYRSKNHQNDF